MKRASADDNEAALRRNRWKRMREDRAASNVYDVSVLSNYLAGNPLIDWLEKHGGEHGLHRTAPSHAPHASGEQQLEWLQKQLVNSTVNARGNFALTRRALSDGAELVLNPVLTCAVEKLAVRPHALLARKRTRGRRAQRAAEPEENFAHI